MVTRARVAVLGAVAALAALAAGRALRPSMPRVLPVDLGAVRTERLECVDEDGRLEPPRWRPFVSITPIGGDEYLLATYRDVYRLSRSRRRLQRLRPVLADDRDAAIQSAGLRWHPTGLAWAPQIRRLFVANYSADDVLAFDLDLAHGRLRLRQRIADPAVDGPENVAVAADGRDLVTANWEGGTVTAFDLTGANPRLRWVVQLPAAHGVSLRGGTVFASTTTETPAGVLDLLPEGLRSPLRPLLPGGQVIVVDFATGRVRRRCGARGADARGFLFPAQVSPFAAQGLLVADAQAGRIALLDPGTCTIDWQFGENGPGYAFVDMPYSVLADTDEVVVLSTFQQRVVFLSRSDLRPTASYATGDALRPEDERERLRVARAAVGAGAPEPMRLWGVPYLPGYGSLVPRQRGAPRLHLPGRASAFANGSAFYRVEAHSASDGVVLSSPQSDRALYLWRRGRTPYLAALEVPFDSWQVGPRLWGPSGARDLWPRPPAMDARAGELEAARRSSGLVTREDFVRIWFPDGGASSGGRLADTFSSPAGRRFFARYATGGLNTHDEVAALARDYFAGLAEQRGGFPRNAARWLAGRGPNLALDEFVTVQMVTGVAACLAGGPPAVSDGDCPGEDGTPR